jgi:transcriptional antiterminator NusG
MSNWFVFYVQTGQEKIACDFLNKLFNKEESSAFIPQIELIFRSSSFIRKEQKPMFPGYVFTDSILDEQKFINDAYKYVRFSKCIFKLLGKQNIDCMKLSESEKNYLLGFCNDKYITEESIGYIIGEKIFIISGPLKGKESIIRKIDRHKRRAEIEIICFGEIRRISVSLEIISKA